MLLSFLPPLPGPGPRRVPWSLLLLALLAILGAGCGQVAGFRVRYEILPPRSASAVATAPVTPASPPVAPAPPTPTPPTSSPTGTPLAGPPTPSPTLAPTPAPSPSPRPGEDPYADFGVPIYVRVELEAPYQIFLRLTSEKGQVVAEDRVSPSGYGIEEKLLRLDPDRYRLKLWTQTLGEDVPLYDKVVELRKDFPPRFQFGLLHLEVPPSLQRVFRRTLEVRIRQEPEQRLVFQRRLQDFQVQTTFGDTLWGKLILPLGNYSVEIEDMETQDDVRLVALDGLPMKRSDPIPCVLSESVPSVLLDLSSMMDQGRSGAR